MPPKGGADAKVGPLGLNDPFREERLPWPMTFLRKNFIED